MTKSFTPTTPAGGPTWARDTAKSAADLFRQILPGPLQLKDYATADLPDPAGQGGRAFKQGLIYDSTTDLLGYSDGADWIFVYGAGATVADARANMGLNSGGSGDIWVELTGDTMTGALTLSFANGGAALVDAQDTGAIGASSGALIRARSAKPTAADQRMGGVLFGALDSSAAIQNSAGIIARSGADWGTLATEETYLDIEVTAAGALTRSVIARYRGYGVQNLGSEASSIRTITATASALATDHTILCDATSGAITVNLPAAAGCSGRKYNVKKIDVSANTVTLDGNGSETIDGATTPATGTQWFNWTIQSNGTSWFIL